jgi:fatty acid desaturase
MGAKSVDTQTLDNMERLEAARKLAEAEALKSFKTTDGRKRPAIETVLLVIAAFSLVVCFYLGFKASGDANTASFKSAVIWPTVIYFIAATALVLLHKDKAEDVA